ncbi:MAG: MATE family efflux transporter [Clostridiaceae bacterium]
MLERKLDLTEGSIVTKLTKLAIPIMGSSFIQMAYNLFDMKFVGNLGFKSAAAVGTAGFFAMLSQSLMTLSRVGAEVHVSQSLGRQDEESARRYATTAIQLALMLAIAYSLFGFIIKKQFIGFFNLNDPEVVDISLRYLSILVFTFPLMFTNYVLEGIFNAGGYSGIPFVGNISGVTVKILSSYFLIYGGFGFKGFGVIGSVMGTILAQMTTFTILFIYLRVRKDKYLKINIFSPVNMIPLRSILRIGGPMAFQNFIFTSISIIIGRVVSSAGIEAVSVQRVGGQIESVSWMTASGFSSALSAFTGQNYGAGKNDRVIKGYYTGMAVVGSIGLFATGLLMLFPKQLFSIFIREPEYVVQMGVTYLVILGISQFFQSLEISTNGAFSGVGLTTIPATYNIIFQSLRIPAALILMNTSLGISGIWWAISISTVFKGITGVLIFYKLVISKLKAGVPLKKSRVIRPRI